MLLRTKCFLLVFTVLLSCSRLVSTTDITDNTCTFKVDGKLFTLAFLNMNKAGEKGYYQTDLDSNTSIRFNFCDPFVPLGCANQNLPSAYSYFLHEEPQSSLNGSHLTCTPFSSDSKITDFTPTYINHKGQIQLNLTMATHPSDTQQQKSTVFLLDCEPDDTPYLTNIKIESVTSQQIVIRGMSPYACPVFELSSLWTALEDNKFIFGIVMFVVGFVMLFYGILMTHLMIFLTAYFLTFAVLASIFTAFLTPDSSRVAIYFSLLFIIFLSTLSAYGLSKLVNVSIFFIGAFFGFILGALINTIFCEVFDMYSKWSLIFFQVIFTIPLGLLTFKYSQQIIILSTSLAGSYMVVRPFSWIFGGFPNEFTIYDTFQSGQMKEIPWTFFLYLVFILGIFALGALYQMGKLQRQQNDTTYVSYLPESVENQLDYIHEQVGKLIYQPKPEEEGKNDEYQIMTEMQPVKPAELAEEKKKENDF